jgi:hypothetical protein
MTMNRILLTIVALLVMLANCWAIGAQKPATKLTLNCTEEVSTLKGAVYLKPTGVEMIKQGSYSPDNGITWQSRRSTPDFDSNLPEGYRRYSHPHFVDFSNGRLLTLVMALDVPGLDPKIIEPPIAENYYYLKYRVSLDEGKTNLFDERLVEKGRTPEHPFEGIHTGKNGYYIGDGSGDRPIRTRSGRIIIPAQAGVLQADGALMTAGHGTYHDAMIIVGDWQSDNSIDWKLAKLIKGDPKLATRGLFEPTVAEMPDGRLLLVMRSSNGGTVDPEYKLPGYKWYSVSSDDGDSWSEAKPWTYDTGENFFSPSAVSGLIKVEDGRVFWVGNINLTNTRGNYNRYPLVIGEVDPESLMLIKDSVLTVDSKRPDEEGLNLSHMWILEDRQTHEIVLAGERNNFDYTANTPVTYRIGVSPKNE